jgi:pyrroline-5-carboxylate reductase
MARLAVIGAGMMGEALTAGLLRAGWAAADIVLTDVRSEHLQAVGGRLGVRVSEDNADAASDAEAVLLAVKPPDAAGALDGLRGDVGVISIVAGLRIASLEDALGHGAAVVRAMPNTPARVGKGVTALAPGNGATAAIRKIATEVFAAVGPVVWVKEDYLDAVTAVSGSGPAYVFLVAEAMVDGGVALGLPRDVAETLAYSTIEGAGKMLVDTGDHPAALRAQVTSPGGTTAAALIVMEAMAVRAAFIEAIRAAHRRSRELGG